MADSVTTAGAVPAPEQPAPGTVTPPSEAPAAATPPAPEPPPTPLAELIAQNRREKEARSSAHREAETLKERLAAAEKELASHKGQKADIVSDPTGYLRAQGLTDEEIFLVAEMAMYEKMPDRAPANLRTRALEAKIARGERERAKAEELAAQNAAQAEAERTQRAYAGALAQAARSPEGFPLSAAWFGDDHGTYVESLMNTARNMAVAAEEAGQVADLSPANVRKVLEDWLDTRVQKLPARPAGAAPQNSGQGAAGQKPKTDPPRGVSAQQVASNTTGTRTPAQSEAERLRRAIAAVEAIDAAQE